MASSSSLRWFFCLSSPPQIHLHLYPPTLSRGLESEPYVLLHWDLTASGFQAVDQWKTPVGDWRAEEGRSKYSSYAPVFFSWWCLHPSRIRAPIGQPLFLAPGLNLVGEYGLKPREGFKVPQLIIGEQDSNLIPLAANSCPSCLDSWVFLETRSRFQNTCPCPRFLQNLGFRASRTISILWGLLIQGGPAQLQW